MHVVAKCLREGEQNRDRHLSGLLTTVFDAQFDLIFSTGGTVDQKY